jgi:hypothetical protein
VNANYWLMRVGCKTTVKELSGKLSICLIVNILQQNQLTRLFNETGAVEAKTHITEIKTRYRIEERNENRCHGTNALFVFLFHQDGGFEDGLSCVLKLWEARTHLDPHGFLVCPGHLLSHQFHSSDIDEAETRRVLSANLLHQQVEIRSVAKL